MSAGMFVLPVILVKVAAVLLADSSPLSALANSVAGGETPAVHPGPQPPTWSTKQLDAAQYVADSRSEAFGPSPLLHESLLRPVQVVVTPTIEPEPDDVPEFSLRAVMAGAKGNKAFINGKLYRVGDEVAETGFLVTLINVAGRTVELDNPQRELTITVKVELPEID